MHIAYFYNGNSNNYHISKKQAIGAVTFNFDKFCFFSTYGTHLSERTLHGFDYNLNSDANAATKCAES